MLKLRRLTEQEEQIAMPSDQGQSTSPILQRPVEPSVQLPAPSQSTVPMDPMTMTVKDFLDKCKTVDPLICMGIESFIQKNTGAFSMDHSQEEPNISFSNAVQPTMPQAPTQVEPFSLDQAPEALNFPE